MKLVSAGFTEGFYYRPRIDRDLLARHAAGLIALSACLGGEIPQAIIEQDFDRARELALSMQAMMGPDHFYLELQSNGLPEQNHGQQRLDPHQP
jgi:DNA polymerase-3 subunit alpha